MLTTQARTGVTIDWVSVTLPAGHQYTTRHALLDQRYEDGGGLYGYTVTRRYLDGSIMATNPDRPEMGEHWIFPGQALNAARDAGLETIDLLHFFALRGGKFTRLDIAVDMYDSGTTIDDYVDAYKNKKCITTLQKARRVENLSERGGTLYIGGKSAKRSMRIYDKAAETGEGGDWIRAELQCRAEIAHGAAITLLATRENWIERAARYVAGVVSWSADTAVARAWAILVSVAGEIIQGRAQAKVADTAKWLLKSVAPSLARLIIETGQDWLEVLGDVTAARYAEKLDRIHLAS